MYFMLIVRSLTRKFKGLRRLEVSLNVILILYKTKKLKYILQK